MAEANIEIRLADRLEAMDAAIIEWAKRGKDQLFRTLVRMGVRDRLKLAKTVTRLKVRRKQIGGDRLVADPFLTASLRYNIRRRNQEIESVGFTFERKGIFLQHGVGRGRPAGSTAAARSRKPWLTEVLPTAVEELADILEDQHADIAAAALVMSIPGVLDTRLNVQVGGSRDRAATAAAQAKFTRSVYDDFLDALNADIRAMRDQGRSTNYK